MVVIGNTIHTHTTHTPHTRTHTHMHIRRKVVGMVIVGNTIHEGVYPLSKAPDLGNVLPRWSATPAVCSYYLLHISMLPIR